MVMGLAAIAAGCNEWQWQDARRKRSSPRRVQNCGLIFGLTEMAFCREVVNLPGCWTFETKCDGECLRKIEAASGMGAAWRGNQICSRAKTVAPQTARKLERWARREACRLGGHTQHQHGKRTPSATNPHWSRRNAASALSPRHDARKRQQNSRHTTCGYFCANRLFAAKFGHFPLSERSGGVGRLGFL